jgi:hypothetical protein
MRLEEAFYSPLSNSQSFYEPVPLGCVNFKHASWVFFLVMGLVGYSGLKLVISLPARSFLL